MSIKLAAPLRIEPDVIPGVVARNAAVHTLPDVSTAEQAARLMAQLGAGAVVVLDGHGRFAGLVTEQDIVREVVAKGLDAATVKIAALVNRNRDFLAPSDLALDAFDLMRIRNVSYLPVIVAERVTAVVSIGDICAAMRQTLDARLHAHEEAFFGSMLQE
jgi:CBS domain-containing protein